MIRRALREIVRTPKETLEAVRAVFSRVDSSFNKDFTGLIKMRDPVNPDIFKYVLSKTVSLEPHQRATDIISVLHVQVHLPELKIDVFDIIQPSMHVLVHSNMNTRFQDVLGRFVNAIIDYEVLKLLNLFLDSGVKFYGELFICCSILTDTTVNLVNCCLDHGLFLDTYAYNVAFLSPLSSFKAHDLARFFRCGLPVFATYRYSWLELAMQNRRLDLAHVAYRHGVRFKVTDLAEDYTPKYEKTLGELANHIAIQNLFDRISGVIAAAFDPQHQLYGLSLSSVYGATFALELAYETALVMSHLIQK